MRERTEREGWLAKFDEAFEIATQTVEGDADFFAR